jgi:hypothetical protein
MTEKVSQKKWLYMCSVYETRPDCCRGYPWNDANEIFPECQFYDAANKKLLTIEETLKFKTQEEIERYCVECGRCCMFWVDGKVIGKCHMLRIVDAEEVQVKNGRYSLPTL